MPSGEGTFICVERCGPHVSIFPAMLRPSNGTDAFSVHAEARDRWARRVGQEAASSREVIPWLHMYRERLQ